MHIMIVHIQVKPETVQAFIEATLDNARGSNQEAGVARWDFLQQADDPTRFVLYEVYRDKEALAAHREAPHYLRWRDAVKDMMAGDRTRTDYVNLYPPADAPDDAW